MRKNIYLAAIREACPVPAHIRAAANACRYDLMYGPSWIKIPQGNVSMVDDDCVASFREDLTDDAIEGDLIEEIYTSLAADALRDFFDSLPSEVWYDADCDHVSDCRPDEWEEFEGFDGELVMQEVDLSNIWHIEHKDIIRALFGETIAREFS